MEQVIILANPKFDAIGLEEKLIELRKQEFYKKFNQKEIDLKLNLSSKLLQ